jgi:hypothetical protein
MRNLLERVRVALSGPITDMLALLRKLSERPFASEIE